jgi:hypothetical protein
MRPDATGHLVKGYLYQDIERACRQAGLSSEPEAPISEGPNPS